MNYTLNNLPERTLKPRQTGYTMAMDKGMSIRETEDFLSMCSDHVDIVKLGWATSYVTPNLSEKIKVFQKAGIPCYFGGTLFEAFIIRNQFEDYLRVLDKYKLTHAEVSDGSIDLDHNLKCDYILKLSKYVTVLSEVGSKDADKIMHIALPIGKSTLMANDVPEFMGKVNENENRSKIVVIAESREEADRIFNGLSAGGAIEVPIDDSPWGTRFGMFRDKYGIEWIIEFDPQQKG